MPEGLEEADQVDGVKRYLDDLVSALEQNGLKAEAIVTGSDPAQTIVEVAEDAAADLIILATHGLGGLDRFMVGSVADRVVKMSTRPVFLVPVRPQN